MIVCSRELNDGMNVYNITYTSCRKSVIFEKRHERVAQAVICNDAQCRLLSKLAGLSISPSYILTIKVGYP